MHRSLFPFILASIGFAVIVLVTSMPLFEWQISEFVADFPSSYEVVASPSPWITRLGDSLVESSYVFGEVSVSTNGQGCLKEGLNSVIKRSAQANSLDQLSLNIYKNVSWLSGWSWIEIILSSFYIVWFTLWSKQGKALHVIFLTGIVVWLFLNMTQILRSFVPFPYPHYFGTVDCYHGTITFNADLSKIHYETMAMLLVGILLEVSVFIMMFRQIRQVIEDRKKSLSSN